MSNNSGAQQRPELPATHTSTAPSPQHPLQQSTANSRPTPTPSSQPYQQSYLSNSPQYSPSQLPLYDLHNPASHLVQSSPPLQQTTQHPTHYTASHPQYQHLYNPQCPPHLYYLLLQSHQLQQVAQYPTHHTALVPHQHSYTTHIPQYPPSRPPSNTPQNPPSQSFSLPQSSHPQQPPAQHLTHLTPSPPHSHYQPSLQLGQTDHSLYQLPTPQSLPHPLNYPPTQLHSNLSYSPQYSTMCPPSHPPSFPPPLHPHPAHHSQYIQSHHNPYPPTHTPTQYTQPPTQPPTDHQSSTPYYPHQYQPPVQPPLPVSSTAHPSPQPTDSYEPPVQPPQVPGTRSVSGSVFEETVPPAKIARLEPSVRPHSARSQHQHNIGTTDRTPSFSQLRATKTAHPTPPSPLLTDDSSDSRQPTPTHTSVTLPLQSHSQSSGSDHPHTTTAVSESLVHHQSRIVEDVLTRYTSRLTETFSNDLHYFSNKFTELGFVRRKAASDILTMTGVGSGGKGDKLLDLVIANFHTSCNKKQWFNTFVDVFSREEAYKDLATGMTQYYSRSCKVSSSSTAYAAHLSPNPSVQSHSDRPSLSSEVGRSQIMTHNEPQSMHTQPQASSYSLSSHMKHFIDYVKALYKGYEVESNPMVVKLTKMPTKEFINLVCIDRNNVGNAREYDKVTEAMVLDGSVDVVHGKKWPIDFNEIAANLPATSLEKVILVEGAPGVGKSTFAWEFCRRWERGEIAGQYQLVLLLRLREERISNARSLEDLFYHPSEDVCRTVIKELKENLGVNTLIILEGFDELPDGCRSASSVFLQLILGQLLPLATVMVTSRPWATRVLHVGCRHRIFQHIEILGFTDQQISLYVKSVLPEKEAIDFEEYLASHPQIRAGMYIPLNSAIVVTVYEESKASGCAMPVTLTELYTSLATTLLRRYMRGHPEYGADCKSIQSFKDLPQPVYTKFCEVCKLAYTGIVGSRGQVQLIYKKCNMPSGFDDLGFMDSTIELYETRPEATSYNFLHLTFQECFAALHICNLSPEEQVEHFKRHEEGRLKVVLRFLAGLTKLNCFSIEEIASNFFQTPSTREGSRYLISCDAAVDIDLVQWLFEAQSDDVIKDVLGEKTIEFYQSSWARMFPLDYYSLDYCITHSQCQWLLGLGKMEIDGDEVRMLVAGAGTRSEPRGRVVGLRGSFNDIMGTNFALTMSINSLNMLFTSWRDILHLHQLSLILPESCDRIIWPDLSALRVLHLGISGQTECKLSTLLPHLSLKALTITSGNGVCSLGYEDCVSIGNHVISTTTLKELCIIFEKTEIRVSDEKGMEAITAALASNQSLPLERLELECECTLTATAGDSLAQFIANTTRLKYLVIMNGCVNTVETITAALASNQSLPLEELDLGWECTLNATAGDSLAQFITNTTTLKHLSIVWCTLSAHVLLVLARATHHNSILETKNVDDYNLTVNGDSEAKDLAQLLVEYPDMFRDVDTFSSNSISDAGAVALAQALHHNSTLLELNLSNNSISDAGAVALAQALHHNSTLLELNVSYNSISDAGAVALAQALHHNSTLTELNLSKNNISDAGTEALAQVIHHNSTLTQLNFSNNSISDAGAVALAQALHHNSTLTELNLSKSNISDAGTEALAQVIHHNSTLTQLNLSNNSISDAGAVALAQAIHQNSTLTELNLSDNDGIGEEGIYQLVQALTVNTSIRKEGLTLPRRCEEYATKCQHYSTVKNRVSFRF